MKLVLVINFETNTLLQKETHPGLPFSNLRRNNFREALFPDNVTKEFKTIAHKHCL